MYYYVLGAKSCYSTLLQGWKAVGLAKTSLLARSVPSTAITLYFDDRAENAEAGKRFGFLSVLVKTNHLEEHQEWQEIIKN